MLIEKIYNGVYAGTEAGKQEESQLGEEIEDLLGTAKERTVDAYALEELLSSAAGIGLSHGFKLGMRFWIQILSELV